MVIIAKAIDWVQNGRIPSPNPWLVDRILGNSFGSHEYVDYFNIGIGFFVAGALS